MVRRMASLHRSGRAFYVLRCYARVISLTDRPTVQVLALSLSRYQSCGLAFPRHLGDVGIKIRLAQLFLQQL